MSRLGEVSADGLVCVQEASGVVDERPVDLAKAFKEATILMRMLSADPANDSRVGVASIELERCEGDWRTELVKATHTKDAWTQADATLTRWAVTAPVGGGYHKCAFVVTFEDGQKYSGRYDLKGGESPSLAKHVRSFLSFIGKTYPEAFEFLKTRAIP